MEILDKLFGNTNIKSTDKVSETLHSVIVYFQYNKDGLAQLNQLESRLEKIIALKKVGVYEGHEIAIDNSDGFLFMYGYNAETLFKAVKPTLESVDFMKGAIANLRFGPLDEDAIEIDVEI